MERALDDTETTGQRWCEPELWRMRAGLFLHDGNDSAEAERSLERALLLTRAWGSVVLEVRSAMVLARLWAERGERAQAAELLAGVLRRFPEGQQMTDVTEATALLHALN